MMPGIQIQPQLDMAQVEAVVHTVREALLQRPSAFPVPCGAVVLPAPEPVTVRWARGSYPHYTCYDAQHRATYSMHRSHAHSIAPLWVGCETRYSDDGAAWTGPQFYMVDNGFGVLVEVPLQ